jgi:transposase
MLKKDEQLRIYDLLDSGHPVAEIAKRIGRSKGTVYNYRGRKGRRLNGTVPERKDRDEVALGPYRATLDSHIRRGKKLSLNVLVLVLQDAGYKGPQSAIKRYIVRRKRELQPQRPIQHVETKEGEQAQVDWGHFGTISINGKEEKVYLFAYILSWSRAVYLEFVVRQNQRTLQLCHINAFQTLGIPKTIVYDNMKTVVSHRTKNENGEREVHFNAAFKDFARYYQFEPIACPPYWPRAKGKVEATIKYVRNYFPRVSPKQPLTLQELNKRLQHWVKEHAHERIHGSTHEKPSARWEKEKEYLSFPGELPPYATAPMQTYTADESGLLVREGITYNLGPRYARLKLEVREIQNHGLPLLEIYRQNKLVTVQPIPAKKHAWVDVGLSAMNNQEKSKPMARDRRLYDIEVEERDLDHYSIGEIDEKEL